MRKNNTGQVLPFCMICICAILLLVLSNFEIGYLNMRKVQQQKKIDGLLMFQATDYAIALNKLAALNEGLRTANNRGKFVMAVYLALEACSKPFPYVCKVPRDNLKQKLRPFYSKLDKLGDDFVAEQEKIISAMLNDRCKTLMEWKRNFVNVHFFPELPCQFYGNYSQLPFYRPSKAVFVSSPLIFKSEFFKEKNRLLLLTSDLIHSPFPQLHPGQMKDLDPKLWAISQIIVDGTNFQNMEFKPRFEAISLSHKFKEPEIVSMLERSKHEIHH